MFPIKSVINESFLRIDLVQYHISIGSITGGESDNFEMFSSSLKEADGIGSYRNISFVHRLLYINSNLNIIGTLSLQTTVNKSFIHI